MGRPLAPVALLSLALATLSPGPRALAQDAGTPATETQATDVAADADAAVPEPPGPSEPQAEPPTEPQPEPEPPDELPPPSDARQQLHLDDDLAPPPPDDDDGGLGIEQYEQQLAPTLVLPEWRIRLGGGVSVQTSGASLVWGRTTQEVEWLPPALQFLSVGIGAAEIYGPGIAAQVGARVGGYAWFCEDALVRCMGAITIQLGAIFGAIGPDFDFSADADLRFLFDRTFELHVRGGFFSVQTLSFVDITAGVGVAF